jgi:hypothetical protein
MERGKERSLVDLWKGFVEDARAGEKVFDEFEVREDSSDIFIVSRIREIELTQQPA